MGIFLVALAFAIILEGTITTLPLVLLILLFLAIIYRQNEVFLIAFLAGLFLDFITLGRIGFSSMYFTIFVYLIYLYQRKFEIETLHFITIFSFFGSFGYLFLIGVKFAFLQSLVAMLLVTTSFIVYKRFNKKAPKYA